MTMLLKWASVTVLAFCIVLLGCPSQSTLSALVATLGQSASNIAQLEGNATLAQKIQTDTAAAAQAISNWKTGTPAQQAIEAIQLVEDDLGLFPQAGPYAPLIVLALGTAQSIIEILNPSAVTAQAHAKVARIQTVPKTAAEYKKQFNQIVASNPALAPAKL